jgi:hypothetical protein
MRAGRRALFTVDFEAFSTEQMPLWSVAMEEWARAASERGIPFAFFVSLEHVAALRVVDAAAYRELTSGLRALSRAGCELHVHNHCLFDPVTGVRSVDRVPFSNPVPGYPHRASMWYDVVRRNGHKWFDWAKELRSEYERLIIDVGVPPPRELAFRAGGWDTGTTAADWAEFVEGLDGTGFSVDSSQLGRLSGTRPGEFTRSAYGLTQKLVELAPCVWMNCGAQPPLRRFPAPPGAALRQWRVAALRQRPGLLVVVVHFDHLFSPSQEPRPSKRDGNGTAERVVRFVAYCDKLLRVLSLRPCRIQEVVADVE